MIYGILAGILFCAGLYAQVPPPRQSKPPVSRPETKKPKPKQQDWFAGAQKRLETLNGITNPGSKNPDFKRLLERASDLIKQAESSRDNQFRHSRWMLAANAMMDASDRVLQAMNPKGEDNDENDSRAAAFVLRGCYFRVRQADYFANVIGDKKTDQYVRLASSLYQQGRSAYDAEEYVRARLLGNAAISVVFALECMAQAVTPDPRIYK